MFIWLFGEGMLTLFATGSFQLPIQLVIEFVSP
jgi:hypothetical protein